VNTASLAFWRCLRAPAWLMLALLAAAWLIARLTAPLRADAEAPADAAAAPWLLMPLTLAVFATVATAIEFWPLFALQRPGASTVERLQRGPLRGCGAVTIGALGALAVWLAGLGAALPIALGGVPEAHACRAFTALAGHVLDERRAELSFTGTSAALVELRLRPVALLPTGAPEPTTLAIEIDGQPVPTAPIAIDNTGQLVRIPIDRALPRFSIRRTGGNLPLLFPDGAVEGIEATAHAGWTNALLAALLLLLPAAVALGAANIAAVAVALPVNLLLVGGCLLLQTLGGLGPSAAAATAVLRGRWLPAEPLFVPALSSLTTAFVAMIVAMVVRRGVRR
jgi:hypothetical protein